MNYFDLPEVSCSDLSALKRMFYGVDADAWRARLEEAFKFGSLVDAMVSEREKLYPSIMALRNEDGSVINYDPDTWRLAERLAKALQTDPTIALLFKSMIGQYIFRRTLTFAYEGEEYNIRGRCKFDGIAKQYATGIDYKALAISSQKELVQGIDFLDYDKQAAYYMDLGRTDYHWIAAVSKKNGKVYKYAIERGDETYNRGVAKYSVWAYRWLLLIDPFSQTLKLSA